MDPVRYSGLLDLDAWRVVAIALGLPHVALASVTAGASGVG